jgi:hypothetical protein
MYFLAFHIQKSENIYRKQPLKLTSIHASK